MKTKLSRKDQMYLQIKQHGENLNAIFDTGLEPIVLCKKLRRLETKAHRLAEDYCNGDIDEKEFIIAEHNIMKSVRKVLNINNEYPLASDDSWPVIFNSDPRGYALKIHDSHMKERCLDLYKDMGGYGIIAPDFSN